MSLTKGTRSQRALLSMLRILGFILEGLENKRGGGVVRLAF